MNMDKRKALLTVLSGFLFVIASSFLTFWITLTVFIKSAGSTTILTKETFLLLVALIIIFGTISNLITLIIFKIALKNNRLKMKFIIESNKDILTIVALISTFVITLLNTTFNGENPIEHYSFTLSLTVWSLTFSITAISLNLIYFFYYRLDTYAD